MKSKRVVWARSRDSAAMRASGIARDRRTLSEFIRQPLEYVSGSTMPFAGIRDEEQRAALVCYLETL